MLSALTELSLTQLGLPTVFDHDLALHFQVVLVHSLLVSAHLFELSSLKLGEVFQILQSSFYGFILLDLVFLESLHLEVVVTTFVIANFLLEIHHFFLSLLLDAS